MNMSTLCIRLFRMYTRRHFSVSTKSYKKNHYDSLGINKTATQADVKSAYYELSKVYHPDKSMGNEENAQKFRDISEAYEVLGNVNLRKLYDKGLYGGTTHNVDDPLHKFYKSREVRSRPPPPTGRTPIYDFDEWSKMHYGATFHRSQQVKKRREHMAKVKAQNIEDIKQEKMLVVMMFIFFICVYMFHQEQKDYDTNFIGLDMPVITKKEKKD